MKVQAPRSLLVKHVMIAKPIAVGASATPRELARILTAHSVSGVPVLDDGGHVIGVVSKTDLLQWCVKGGLGFGASNLLTSLANGVSGTRIEAIDLGIVADFMSTRPITARPDEPLTEAAQRMVQHRVHRLIVVDEAGALRGIVTSMDLLKVYPAAA